MKNDKIINLICVFLVLIVILSAMLIASYAIFNDSPSSEETQISHPSTSKNKPIQNDTPGITLRDLDGLLNLNGMLGLSSFINGSIDFNVYNVKSTETSQVYFKIKSFGDYNGANEWEEANEYFKKLNNTYSAVYIPALLFEATGSQLASIEIDSTLDQYILPYYPSISQNKSTQDGDVVCSGDSSETYTIYYYTPNSINDIIKEAVLDIEFEREYRNFVYENYLEVDPKTKEYMGKLIRENGFDPSSPQIIETVADFISKSARYDLLYDRSLDSEDNVAIAFLETYKTGICQHYATAATLLFRTLGIPARYTIGFSAATVADQWVGIKSSQAHAWVEVYLNGVGWIYVEVTGSAEDNLEVTSENETTVQSPQSEEPPYESTPNIIETSVYSESPTTPDNPATPPPRPPESSEDVPPPTSVIPPQTTEPPKQLLTVSPEKVEKRYDGKTLYASDEISGFKEYEKKGYTYKVTISGERTEPGRSASVIEDLTIFDPNGKDVTSQFEIIKSKGVIQVYLQELTIISEGAEKTYNGTPLTKIDSIFMSNLDNKDHRYNITITGSQTNAGTSNNSFTVAILDENDNDVTDNYKIVALYGKLTVTPAEITLIADDAEKQYDGKPLFRHQFTVDGILAVGDKIIKCDFIGQQTEIGRSDNIIDADSIIIENEYGENVTSNYSINLVAGKLKVTP